MPKLSWSWRQKDKGFIKMMEQYENNDAFEKANQKEVWREISMRVGMPASYCRRKWTSIKHNYLKLKYMIHVGNVTEDMVCEHINTSKYLDGSLDFLARFMFKIHEEELSSSAHNFFNSAFGASACTQSEEIKDSKQEIGIEPMSMPNIDNYESGSSITHFEQKFVNLGMDEAKEVYRIDDDSNDVVFVEPAILPDIQISTSFKEDFVDLGIDQAINEVYGIDDNSNDVAFVEPAILPALQISTSLKEEFVDLGKDQEIKEDYRIHDDLNDVQFVASDILPNIKIKQADSIGDNGVTNVTNNCTLKDILLSTKKDKTKSSKLNSENSGNLAIFLVNYANSKNDINCNLKEYMYDLAEVLCRRLVPGKRKYFLSRVDLIVSKILEEKEG